MTFPKDFNLLVIYQPVLQIKLQNFEENSGTILYDKSNRLFVQIEFGLFCLFYMYMAYNNLGPLEP